MEHAAERRKAKVLTWAVVTSMFSLLITAWILGVSDPFVALTETLVGAV